MSSADLAMCYGSLKEANLPNQMNQEILKALDTLATTDTHNNTVGRLASSGQECKSFQKYLTEMDNVNLQQCSMWEGCLVITKRLKLLGVCGMKESLKKVCLGILVWHEMQRNHSKAPNARAIYSLGHDLVSSLRTLQVEVPPQATCLACYPDDPVTTFQRNTWWHPTRMRSLRRNSILSWHLSFKSMWKSEIQLLSWLMILGYLLLEFFFCLLVWPGCLGFVLSRCCKGRVLLLLPLHSGQSTQAGITQASWTLCFFLFFKQYGWLAELAGSLPPSFQPDPWHS